MKTYYLIGFDLDKGSKAHDTVNTELEETYEAHRFLDLTTTWIIECDLSKIKQVDKYLLSHVQESGSLFVIPFGDNSDQWNFYRFVHEGKKKSVADIGFVLGFNSASSSYQRRTPRTR